MKEKIVVLLSSFCGSYGGLSLKGHKEMELFETKLLKTKYPNIKFDILSFDDAECEHTAQAVSNAVQNLGGDSSYQILTEKFNPVIAVEKIKNYKGNLILVASYFFIIEVLKLLKYCKDEVYIGTREGVIIDSYGAFQLIKDLKIPTPQLELQSGIKHGTLSFKSVSLSGAFFIY